MGRRSAWLLVAALVAASVDGGVVSSFQRLLEDTEDEEHTVPFDSWSNVPDTLSHLLAFVLVLLGAHPLGLFFPRYFRLPLITGYLVAGILSGPFLANLLNEDVVDMLGSYVNAFALSFISFQAGQEIYLPELRPQIKAIVALLGTYYCTAMVLGTSVFMLAAGAFFYADLAHSCQLGIALMFASISVLVSPSTVMALKIELNSVGPFTHLALGTCMTAEFVVLVSFSVSRVVASIYCAKLAVSVESIIFTMGVVLMNLVLGALLGLVTILIFQLPSGQPDMGQASSGLPAHGVSVSSSRASRASRASASQHHKKVSQRSDSKQDMSDLEQAIEDPDQAPHPHNAYVEETDADNLLGKPQWWTERKALYLKGFIWLLMGYLFYLFTNTLSDLTTAHFGLVWQVKFEALLVLMLASCAAGHYAAIRPQMHVILDTVAPYMFLPFFVMTGASLQLDKVVSVLPMMSLYLVLRYTAIFLAVYGGGRFLLKLPPRHYKHLWLTMAPQAGVSLGLAAEVKELITDDWGAEFSATIVAAVVINQVVGPVLCSIGLRGAGETMIDRQAAAAALAQTADQAKDGGEPDVEAGKDAPAARSLSRHGSARALNSARSGKDPRPLLPFYRVQSAVVLGDDEVAFEIALELSLYGARVNVPLLDEARADKWRRMNETILQRTAKGELISFQNSIQDRLGEAPSDSGMQNADVLIFTGTPERSLEHARVMQTMLGEHARPRLIAVVDDCAAGAKLRELGVLTVQPAIALGNIVTRLALLDAPLATNLSKELSSTSDFSTAAYFRGEADGERDSITSLSELRLPARRLALGRSVVNHHSVDYDRLAEALAAENLPMPPPPSRVSMFGMSAVEHDPFAKRSRNLGAHEHFVVEDDAFDATDDRSIFEEQFVVPSPSSSGGRTRSGRLSRRRSRLGSSSSSVGGGSGYVTLHRAQSTGL
jgi:Kef-type K+ transport system membrane component KefB